MHEGWFPIQAERVVTGQRALLNDVDDHLGWLILSDGPYSVRERSPFEETFPFDELTSMTRLVKLAEQWGLIVAAAHARADADFDARFVPGSFEAAVDGLTDGDHAGFRSLVRGIAAGYADQVEADYRAFLELAER